MEFTSKTGPTPAKGDVFHTSQGWIYQRHNDTLVSHLSPKKAALETSPERVAATGIDYHAWHDSAGHGRLTPSPRVDIDVFSTPKGHQQLAMGQDKRPYRVKGVLRMTSTVIFGESRETTSPVVGTVQTRYYLLRDSDMATIRKATGKTEEVAMRVIDGQISSVPYQGDPATDLVCDIIYGRSHCKQLGASQGLVATNAKSLGRATLVKDAHGQDIGSADAQILASWGIGPVIRNQKTNSQKTKTPSNGLSQAKDVTTEATL